MSTRRRPLPYGPKVLVIDNAELDDDLVRDMTEALTSSCARLYGRRGVRNLADKALRCQGRCGADDTAG